MPEIYEPILDFLADHRPHSIRDLEIAVAANNIEFGQVMQAVMLLSGLGQVGFAQPEADIAAARPKTMRLNKVLMDRNEHQDSISYLASPVTGGAIPISRIDQMFLKAWAEGEHDPAKRADTVWRILEAAGHRALQDGQVVETAEENRTVIAAAEVKFTETLLPLFKGLEIAVPLKMSPAGRKGSR